MVKEEKITLNEEYFEKLERRLTPEEKNLIVPMQLFGFLETSENSETTLVVSDILGHTKNVKDEKLKMLNSIIEKFKETFEEYKKSLILVSAGKNLFEKFKKGEVRYIVSDEKYYAVLSFSKIGVASTLPLGFHSWIDLVKLHEEGKINFV